MKKMNNTKKLGKKGQAAFTISDLGTVAIALVVAVIIIGLGATILQEIQATTDTDVNLSDPGTFNVAFNTTAFGLTGLLTLSSFVPTIAIVAAAAIVIGIILVFFGRPGR